MLIKQLYTASLKEAAYYIESNGEAAIIDPIRDIDVYLELAKTNNTQIKYIFETHFHGDFVSGHIDLNKATGAPIIFGPGAETKYKVYNAKDGETFKLGYISITVLHTPGHTTESCCYLVEDEQSKAHAIFTGDTLLVGDVGRPDLSSGQMSSEELAEIMYVTLQHKIMPLTDDIIIYPAHGASSSNGEQLSPLICSTIGDEKKNNFALQLQTKEQFVNTLTNGLLAAPKYFAKNALINQQGYNSISEIITKGTKALTPNEFKEKINEDAILLDSRKTSEFTEGFIQGSIFIGLEGKFEEWAASLLPVDKPIVLVSPRGMEKETVIRLSRVGFYKIEGYIKGGFEAWKKAGEKIDMIIDVEADELIMDIPHDPNLTIVDVRKEDEFAEGHLPNALNLPLIDMTEIVELAQFEDNQNLYVHSEGGYRSVIAASLLKRQGVHNLRNVLGGWAKLRNIEKKNSERNQHS